MTIILFQRDHTQQKSTNYQADMAPQKDRISAMYSLDKLNMLNK